MGINRWNELIAGVPGAHLPQSCAWSQAKVHYGWQPPYLVWTQGQAMSSSWNPAIRFFKRLSNIVVSALGLLLLSPFFYLSSC